MFSNHHYKDSISVLLLHCTITSTFSRRLCWRSGRPFRISSLEKPSCKCSYASPQSGQCLFKELSVMLTEKLVAFWFVLVFAILINPPAFESGSGFHMYFQQCFLEDPCVLVASSRAGCSVWVHKTLVSLKEVKRAWATLIAPRNFTPDVIVK